MSARWLLGTSLSAYFLLVFALCLPFWAAGALTGLQLLPGIPVSSLMFLGPVTSALVLVYRGDGVRGVTELLKRSFDHKRIRTKVWYIPILLLMPAVAVVSYGLIRLLGWPLPDPQLPALLVLATFLIFLVEALCEEIGWSGYATDQMQRRWTALLASLLLGLIWAVWHFVPWMQVGRSADWIAWQSLCLVATRVLLVWLYNNTGRSVLATAVFHAMQNVTWQLFPINGSHYDPRVTGLVVALVAAIVTILWGPRTLARYGHRRSVGHSSTTMST